MQSRSVFLAIAIVLAGTQALAGSRFQANIVVSPPDCYGGLLSCLNVNTSCSFDNSECALGTMSPKSQLRIDGKLRLRTKLAGITDSAGLPLTTGPAETAADNLILQLVTSNCPVDTGLPACDTTQKVYLKVVVTDGAAKLDIDLAPVFALSAGSPFVVTSVKLLGSTPLACAGDNSPAGILGRIDDAANCDIGIVRGNGGVLVE